MSTIKQKAEGILEEKNKNCVPENIREGATIFGVQGNFQANLDTTDATATASDIETGKTAYIKETKVTGTLPKRNALNYNDITVDNSDSTNISMKVTNDTKQIIDSNVQVTLSQTKKHLADGIDLSEDKILKGNNVLGIEGNAGMLNIDYNTCVTLANDILGVEIAADTKVYGIKRYIDAITPEWSRTKDAIGLRANMEEVGIDLKINDFNSIYPWSAMRICNYDAATNTIVAYKDDNNFSMAPSNKSINVMVEVPSFYYRCYLDDENYINYEISASNLDGFHKFKKRLVSATGIVDFTYPQAKFGDQKDMDRENGYIHDFQAIISKINNIAYEYDYETYGGLCLLYLVEYATYNWSSLYNSFSSTHMYLNSTTNNDCLYVNKKYLNLSYMIYHSPATDKYYNLTYRGICDFYYAWTLIGGLYYDTNNIITHTNPSYITSNMYLLQNLSKNKNLMDSTEITTQDLENIGEISFGSSDNIKEGVLYYISKYKYNILNGLVMIQDGIKDWGKGEDYTTHYAYVDRKRIENNGLVPIEIQGLFTYSLPKLNNGISFPQYIRFVIPLEN